MAIVVEHDKRKQEILQKSLDVFIEEGYEDATFQKIADRCGITRTTLYIYFKNKHEIFLGSIKELLAELDEGWDVPQPARHPRARASAAAVEMIAIILFLSMFFPFGRVQRLIEFYSRRLYSAKACGEVALSVAQRTGWWNILLALCVLREEEVPRDGQEKRAYESRTKED